jgi:uncharacterized repeat protein (TIGR03803 family)
MFNWKKMSAVLIFGAAVTGLEAQTLTTLVAFNGANGALPLTLIQGADGNFYGTTQVGGVANGGIFFKMTPAGTLTTLYNFAYQELSPISLIQGSDGNFYGTAEASVVNETTGGTIFKITPAGVFTALYHFGANGGTPQGTMIQAADGNFYGTTVDSYLPGAALGGDTIYKMTPAGSVTILYTFPVEEISTPDGGYNYYAPNGALPVGLVQGTDGNFYGTTAYGGIGGCQVPGGYDNGVIGCGTVFKISPAGALSTLYSFTNSTDGSYPTAPLVQGTDGNFYGTTSQSNNLMVGNGTVFRITPAGALTTLYAFTSTDLFAIDSPLIPAPSGSFYGITLHRRLWPSRHGFGY